MDKYGQVYSFLSNITRIITKRYFLTKISAHRPQALICASEHREFQSMTNKIQHYTVFYLCKLLYMFRVDPAPIIRSITLYLRHLVYVKPLLLPAAIVDDFQLFHDGGR